jgi:hypothetical protein
MNGCKLVERDTRGFHPQRFGMDARGSDLRSDGCGLYSSPPPLLVIAKESAGVGVGSGSRYLLGDPRSSRRAAGRRYDESVLEQIVCTPEDALRCFVGTDVEALVVGNCFLWEDQQDAALKRNYSHEFELD